MLYAQPQHGRDPDRPEWPSCPSVRRRRGAQSSHGTRSRSRSRWLTTTNADPPKDVSFHHQILVVTRRLVPFRTPSARARWLGLLPESGTGSSSFSLTPQSDGSSSDRSAVFFLRAIAMAGFSPRPPAGFAPSCVHHGGFGPPTPDPGIRSGLAHRGRGPVPSAHGTPAAMCVPLLREVGDAPWQKAGGRGEARLITMTSRF